MKGILLLLFGSVIFFSVFAQKPNIWIHTDLTAANSYITTSTTSKAVTDQGSDADDHVALAQYLMLANKFNTKKIVVGVTNRNTTNSNTGTWVQTAFCDNAYALDYPGMNSRIGGFPSPDSIKNCVVESSLTAGSGYTNFSSSPDNKYDNYNDLPATVKLLVDELNKTEYSSTNPLYVLVWGGLQEVAMATKHLIRNNNTDALSRLYVVSHWTMSYYHQGSMSDPYDVANCNTSSAACDYMHNQAKAIGAKFKFVDAAATGQHGIVSGSSTFFNGGFSGANATELKKSKLGNLAMKSKFEYKPDGSDCASFYTVLGTYGVTLSSFATNGATTSTQELNAENAYKANATKIWNDLLVVSNAAAAGPVSNDTESPTAPTGLTSLAITQTSFTLFWTASTDNVGVVGYDVLEGTTVVKSVTATSASITGLACNTTHTYSVKAKDAAGNISDVSAEKAVTILACENNVSVHYQANDKFTLDLSKLNRSALIEVFNTQGNIVYRRESKNSKLPISTTGWKSGIYFVSIKTSEKSHVQKIMVK